MLLMPNARSISSPCAAARIARNEGEPSSKRSANASAIKALLRRDYGAIKALCLDILNSVFFFEALA